MLRWQCKILKKHRRRFFWGKLLLVSVAGHIVLLFGFLFAYKGNYFSFAVTVNRSAIASGAPVVFLPFKNKVGSRPIIKKTALVKPKKIQKKSRSKPKKQTVVSVSAKASSSSAKATEDRSDKEKNKVKPQKKKTVAKKTTPKKVVEKKARPEQSRRETIKIAKKKQSKKQDVAKAKSEEKIIEKAAVQESENPIYVGQVEMAALQMQEEMQMHVSQLWKPPAGLPNDLHCVVKIVIDWNGNPHEAIVEKTSGVLVYDISARTAVAQLQELPRWARGKEFSITFKQ